MKRMLNREVLSENKDFFENLYSASTYRQRKILSQASFHQLQALASVISEVVGAKLPLDPKVLEKLMKSKNKRFLKKNFGSKAAYLRLITSTKEGHLKYVLKKLSPVLKFVLKSLFVEKENVKNTG